MELTRKLFALLLALLLALSAPLALMEEAPAEAPPAETAEESGNFFAGLKLTYLDGSPFDASVFEGKPIFLNIWATWCGPCIMELPHLNELAEQYKDRILIIGLHSEGLTVNPEGKLEPNEETNLLALGLQQDKNLTYPLLNPDTNLFVLMNMPEYGLRVSALPTTWLIDGEGFVRQVIPGANSKEGWEEVILKFLESLETQEAEKTEG